MRLNFELGSVAAENLAILGATNLNLESRHEIPLTGLTWFRHKRALCAVITSPTEYITVLYGVFKKFEELSSDVTEEISAMMIGKMVGDKILQFCKAFVVGRYNPGGYEKLRLVEAGGSGRAATQLRERVYPGDLLFDRSTSPPVSPWLNVGISHYVGGSSYFVDCDKGGKIIRELTEHEKVLTSTGVRTRDEIMAIYSKGEGSNGIH